MTNESNTQVPVVRDYGEIQLKKGSATVRHIIESALCDPELFHEIKPYFIDGGVCGHKVMDIKGAVDRVKKHDKEKKLQGFKLNDFQLGNALKAAMRSRYELDKRWKIQGENSKRVLAGPQE